MILSRKLKSMKTKQKTSIMLLSASIIALTLLFSTDAVAQNSESNALVSIPTEKLTLSTEEPTLPSEELTSFYSHTTKYICWDERLIPSIEDTILVMGNYTTVVNMHNPNPEVIPFRWKVVWLLPGPGGATEYRVANAGPDAAFQTGLWRYCCLARCASKFRGICSSRKHRKDGLGCNLYAAK